MQVPVACTLSNDAASERLAEWRRFFAASSAGVEWPNSHRLRVRLVGTDSALVSARDLARREKACCAFFGFSIDIETEASWLSIEVPADAAEVLTQFASLLPA